MSCFFEEKGDGVRVILRFRREDLLYDIKNYAYIEGSLLEDGTDHRRHTVQDVGEEGNVDRITRILNLAVSRCREMLYPFTKREIERKEFDDRLREIKVYGIGLDLPDGFSQTTLFLLERLVHEYLVCTAVADWMSITNPDKTATWREKSEEAKAEIQSTLHTRRGRVRRRLHPF